MSRTCRLDWENAYHHVMARGIDKGLIFSDDGDRSDFVERMGRCVEQTDMSVLAWSLMPNHFHLLLRTGRIPLAKFMHKLLTGHAVHFNKKHDRVGHLFQNRYLSILVQSEIYLLELVRYIHLNPLRAGIVKCMGMLDVYPWTGHYGMLNPETYTWQDTHTVLKEISGNKTADVSDYLGLIRSSDVHCSTYDVFDTGIYVLGTSGFKCIHELESKNDGAHTRMRILGNIDYARRVYENINQNRAGILRNRSVEHSCIEKLFSHASRKWGLSVTLLRSGSRSRRISRAREYLSYALTEEFGLRLTDSAKLLNISPEGVRKSAQRYIDRISIAD